MANALGSSLRTKPNSLVIIINRKHTRCESANKLVPSLALLQHQRRQVPLQDRVLDRAEHDLNVLGVDRVREVMIDGRFGILAHVHEHLQDEVLHVQDRVRIAGELRIVPADVRVRIFDLLRQQIRLVQEQDDRDALERGVVYNRVEDIPRLLQAIGFPTEELS